MSDTAMSIAERYVRLALATEAHVPGNVDAYYGPPEWREQIAAAGTCDIDELIAETEALAEALAAADMEQQRKDFLEPQVRAIRTTLHRAQGEPMTMTTEVEAIFDVRPTWTDEAIFEEGHRVLDELLPAGGTLTERMATRKATHRSASRTLATPDTGAIRRTPPPHPRTLPATRRGRRRTRMGQRPAMERL